MVYEINRTLGWIGEALDRARGKAGTADAANPRVIPDVILPKVDIFGWEALQRIKTDSSTAAVGVEEVFPRVTSDWPAGVGTGGLVPPSVALRLMYAVHVQHNDTDPSGGRFMWLGLQDREGGSTGLPTETGTGGMSNIGVPNDTPLVVTRVFVLRPTENFIGRVRALGPTFFLSMFYSWIDLKEGEYISGQIF